MLLDSAGYATPAVDVSLDWLNDHDGDLAPPEAWDTWTDAERWELGPDSVHQALQEIRYTAEYLGNDPPVTGAALERAADVFERAVYEPNEADMADYREWCQELDRRWQEERMDRDEPEFPGVISPGLAHHLAYGRID